MRSQPVFSLPFLLCHQDHDSSMGATLWLSSFHDMTREEGEKKLADVSINYSAMPWYHNVQPGELFIIKNKNSMEDE